MTYIKVAKTTFTTASSVSIENCFSAGYTHYLVVRNLLGTGTNENIKVRLRVSSTDATAAEYREQYVSAESTTITGARLTANTSWLVGLGFNELTTFGHAQLRLSNPFEAVRTTAWLNASSDADNLIGLHRRVFAHDAATSYTGLTFIPNTGTITGSITVYGMKESA